MKPAGSAEELYRRRHQALRWLKRGISQLEVSRRLAVDARSVRRWQAAVRQGGNAALRPKSAVGGTRKLTPAQRTQLAEALTAGARAASFDSDLWSVRRIAGLIRKGLWVSCHER